MEENEGDIFPKSGILGTGPHRGELNVPRHPNISYLFFSDLDLYLLRVSSHIYVSLKLTFSKVSSDLLMNSSPIQLQQAAGIAVRVPFPQPSLR